MCSRGGANLHAFAGNGNGTGCFAIDTLAALTAPCEPNRVPADRARLAELVELDGLSQL